jgi:heme exporter protein D
LEEIDEKNHIRRKVAEEYPASALAVTLTILALALLPEGPIFNNTLKALWVGVVIGSSLRSFFFPSFRNIRLGLLKLILPLFYFATWIFPDWDFSPLWWLAFLVLVIPIMVVFVRFQAKTEPLRNEYRNLRRFLKSTEMK